MVFYPPDIAPLLPGGRLTLTSGTPVTTTDVTAASAIYYCPYLHDRITLWTGSFWLPVVFTEKTYTLSGLTSGKPYDLFGYLSSGTLALEALVWTNDTTRATAVTLQDGRYCKSGDKTRLYLGTFYTTGTTTTEDSKAKRLLWNMYNRVAYRDYRDDSANSWTDSGNGTWSAVNSGGAVWKHEFVRGIAIEPVSARACTACNQYYNLAVAIDSATSFDRTKSTVGSNQATGVMDIVAFFADTPTAGYHYLQAIETTNTNMTGTAYGDNNLAGGSGNSFFQAAFMTEGFR